MRYPPITLMALRRQMSTTVPRRVPLLITPKELKQLPKSTTLPLDVSWHMPNSNRSAVAEYLSGPRIPGARRLDLDEVAELDIAKNPLSLTHMLPTAEKFKEAVENLGISDDTHVVLYDTLGVFSSPRGVYTFKAFGHDKVSALDGGLPRWIDEGNEVEMGDVGDIGPGEYKGAKGPDPEYVRSYEQIVKNAELSPDDKAFEVVLDARSKERYEGTAPEPRPSLSSGHIPNSLPLPFVRLLNPSSDSIPYTSYKSPSELKEILVEAVGGPSKWDEIANGEKNLVFSCGSGMTAGIGWLATELIKEKEGGDSKLKAGIYDESWTGYASRGESKIVKGPKGQ